MTGVRGILELQVEALLTALHAQRDARCREIDGEAAQKSQRLLRDSRIKLRQRLREAVNDERRQRETALLEAHHCLETAERRAMLKRYQHFLDAAWPELLAALNRRWHDTESRHDWCEMLLDEAGEKLVRGSWIVEVPGSWGDDDTRRVLEAFERRGFVTPTLRIDTAMQAGLRIRMGSACLDATPDGLLANRSAVEARLLAEWERVLADSAGQSVGMANESWVESRKESCV